MRIGKVIGTVTSSTIHSTLIGGQFKIVRPFTLDDLVKEQNARSGMAITDVRSCDIESSGTEVIVYDELSAGTGEWVAFSEGAEAAAAFYPNFKPVDAYAAAIIDTLEISTRAINRIQANKKSNAMQ